MKGLILSSLFFLSLNALSLHQTTPKWVVYYNDQADVSEFSAYNPIVLDSDYHPNLLGFIQRKKTILGYISLGEVEKERSYFNAVKNEGILLEENQYWPGSFFVDLRDPRWTKRVIEELIPQILMQKFHGLFFDTLDNAAHLERKDPEKYRGMTAAAVNLVKAIRMHYPQIKIMMNRGYELLPEVVNILDMELGESVFSDYNFEKKTYQHVSQERYQQQVKMLKDAQKMNPKLQIYTLDYWDPKDSKEVKRIYQEQRKNGFIPYVTTVDLHHITPEPLH